MNKTNKKLFLYIKKFFLNLFSILHSIWIVGVQSFSKRETHLYPDIPVKLYPRYRGRIVLTRDPENQERCVACNLCSVVCPVSCISLQKKTNKNGRWYPKFFRINFSRCIFCGLCEEACPTFAIQLIPDFEMSEYNRKDLIYEKEDLLISGTGKYPKYNFYQHTGIKIKGKKKGHAKNEYQPIDIKELLP
ncbi:NADH-quinone oxidoreductase subunit I [Candidatus Westeberhardia cardiocondylae]|uniref:NADH-quinone oxidoreductase subunit I n=1 Tax=Candidatus Westeberhardia cardiocondylae TaxID=1594731 RepID=A0A0H5BX31_9ENTR|nr:NADH-quinone oxidoreductase subunit NuoI [Candidatus Westeberhardia cardiocondylae]MCR3756219.1 NADH:quinone oxidoreductase subunit I [Candidatus Westeberhardia cardiocondylae]CEN32325.1 NADH-quinone oxidoreductase subunit I [Candidatus Westeberhardia cardiocondylae]